VAQSRPSTPQGYKGSVGGEAVQIIGLVIAVVAIFLAIALAEETHSVVGGAVTAVYGVVLGVVVWAVGATLENVIAIRAHLDGSLPLHAPAAMSVPPSPVVMELYDVRLIAVGQHPDRVARELRQAVSEDRIPGLMANLPATVVEGVGYATAKGLELALTEKGATVEMSRRGSAD